MPCVHQRLNGELCISSSIFSLWLLPEWWLIQSILMPLCSLTQIHQQSLYTNINSAFVLWTQIRQLCIISPLHQCIQAFLMCCSITSLPSFSFLMYQSVSVQKSPHTVWINLLAKCKPWHICMSFTLSTSPALFPDVAVSMYTTWPVAQSAFALCNTPQQVRNIMSHPGLYASHPTIMLLQPVTTHPAVTMLQPITSCNQLASASHILWYCVTFFKIFKWLIFYIEIKTKYLLWSHKNIDKNSLKQQPNWKGH